MVVHWKRSKEPRRKLYIAVNGVGAALTAIALLIIIVAKFVEGAWVVLIIIPLGFWLFHSIHCHYERVHRAIDKDAPLALDAHQPILVVAPIGGWNLVTERAIRFALEIGDEVIALHIHADEKDVELKNRWPELVEEPAKRAGLTPPRLEVVISPYRKIAEPIVKFVQKMQSKYPDRVIAVVVPELVQQKWYEYLLHGHYAETLRARLLLDGDNRVIVVNTPWHLDCARKVRK